MVQYEESVLLNRYINVLRWQWFDMCCWCDLVSCMPCNVAWIVVEKQTVAFRQKCGSVKWRVQWFPWHWMCAGPVVFIYKVRICCSSFWPELIHLSCGRPIIIILLLVCLRSGLVPLQRNDLGSCDLQRGLYIHKVYVISVNFKRWNKGHHMQSTLCTCQMH